MKKKLKQWLSEYYTPPKNHGWVKLNLTNEKKTEAIYFHLGSDLLTTTQKPKEEIDSIISMPKNLINYIIEKSEEFEPRSDIYTSNTKTQGNGSLIHHFSQLFKRTSNEANQALDKFRSRSYPLKIQKTNEISDSNALKAIKNSSPTIFLKAIKWDLINKNSNEIKTHLNKSLQKNAKIIGNNDLNYFFKKQKTKNENRAYTNGAILPKELHHFFPWPFSKILPFTPYQIWLGQTPEKTATTKLHCDLFNSFLVQIHGEKDVYLYAPNQHSYLYPVPNFVGYQPCQVNPLEPDYEKHPLYKKAQNIHIKLLAGDLLLIPAGWYHYTTSSGLTMSISRGLYSLD